ncbi:F-box and WD repeat domain containing protein 10B isoform X2 [Hypanus sabinus]|uniref:F-box and WD repeat domain containing protein 10B isoform X2 n=1 Tax=Hypanus sabinus TaxID=79690 RepID=UPI0028C3E8A7|nr:F-box and WD repeat domain containing protein 10B isoform X2 [Hypanus sabinus]
MKMLHLDAVGEVSEFNICSTPSYSCLAGGCSVSSCGSCYACILQMKLVASKQWFLRAGDLSKQLFLKGLIRRIGSRDLLQQVDRLLQPTFGKDFTHSRSCANPSLPGDLSTQSSDRSLNKSALREYISDTWEWFANSRYWTKANYILGLLQLCDVKLLHLLANLVRALILSERMPDSPVTKDRVKDEDTVLLNESRYSFKIDEHPELQELVDIWPQFTVVTPDIMPRSFRSQPKEVVDHNQPAKKRLAKKKMYSLNEPQDVSTETESSIPLVITSSFQATSGVSNYKDFLRCLPVHLAKYILGLLDDESFQNCMLVSKHWQYLAKELSRDLLALHCIFDEVLKLQEIVPQNVSAVYAKICHVPVPRVDENGLTIPMKNFDKMTGLTAAYTDIDTDVIQMEERNVYCGPYNIKVIKQQTDPSRVIHYNGGTMIASGSSDRKIRFLDISRSKDITNVIQGHAGSIKALFLCEEHNFVLSGSFDLSIRRWNLMTGSCMTIYRGHMGYITSLELHKDRLVSGAMDCLTKVWDLEQGKCLSSLRHNKPVLSVAISEKNVISGCENGEIYIWNLESNSIAKILSGHQGPVTCLSFDQWHLVSGSKDETVKAWSMIGKFNKCLLTFRHPREVLCLHHLYLRVLSSCSDGKIRIFDLYRGTCLRVMRASGRGDPVLSFHLSEKSIVINTVAAVIAFRFEDVTWDYAAPSSIIESPAQEDLFKMAPLRKQPHSYVRAQRMRRIGSTNEKIYHRQEYITQQGLSHHTRLMSSRCMQLAQRIQSDSMKVPNLREFQYYGPESMLVNQKSEFLSKQSPTGCVSIGPEVFSQGRISDYTLSSSGYDKRTDSLSRASRFRYASEQDILKQIKKNRLSRPRTSEKIYLTVSTIHNSTGSSETEINTVNNISLSVDWGQHQCPLKDMERRFIAKKHAVQSGKIIEKDTESTEEYVDIQPALPSFDFKKQKPMQNFALQSPNTKCFAIKPMIKRSKSTLGFVEPVQSFSQKKRPQTAFEDIIKKNKVSNDAKERNQLSGFLVPVSTIPSVAAKPKSEQSVNINPFRNRSGFKLRTLKQRKEYEEEIIAEQNMNRQRLEQEKRIANLKAIKKRS